MLQPGVWILLALMLLGALARNSLIVVAAGALVITVFLRVRWIMQLVERRGTEVGLICLLAAVLVPFATGEVGTRELRQTFTTWPGLAGVVGGVIAAVLSGRGVALLEVQPEIIVGLVVGSILGVVIFRGIPVGPLAAAGFAAVLLHFLR